MGTIEIDLEDSNDEAAVDELFRSERYVDPVNGKMTNGYGETVSD